jgi:hypothetical protein
LKTRNLLALLSMLIFAILSTSSLQATDRMKSGQWEVTVSGGGRSAKNTHCVSQEQAKIANGSPEEIRASLEKSAVTMHCTLQDFKLEKNNVSFLYACPAGSTESKTEYSGDTYDTTVITKDGTEEHTAQFKGRRLGDCPADK